MKSFPFYRQLDSMDCGPTCLRMVAEYLGRTYSLQVLREKSYIDRAGVSLKGISEAAEAIGLRTLAIQVALTTSSQSSQESPTLIYAPLPCIVHWNQNHFVVVYKITKSHVYIADPADDKIKLTHAEFCKSYCSDGDLGVALLLEPTPQFYDIDDLDDKSEKHRGLSYIRQYLVPHRRLVIQVIIGLLLGTVFQMILPFLTQSIVDVGIEVSDLHFIYIILLAQLMLTFSQTTVKFIQSWNLLQISTRINVSMVSDFLIKIMRLPIHFFESKNAGDIMQRIGDHRRIESFLTNSLLSFLLAIINLIVFSGILLLYNQLIFFIFIIAAVLYIAWITFFLKKRKEIDYKSFQQMADNQDALYEIIQGMQEIKLQGSYFKRRWMWSSIQAKLFRVQMRSLAIGQYQDAGAQLITQVKDILITIVAAKAVIEGELTLGTMLAIQYIIGQLNSPLQQLVSFIRAAQDASISLERIREMDQHESEHAHDDQKIAEIPTGDIVISNLSFKYTEIQDEVLSAINVTIARGKTTAIVGSSGSGKTTLMKILLGFYPKQSKAKQSASYTGNIKIGNTELSQINTKVWREEIGAVMQDGYIFYDTIACNIAESEDQVDYQKLTTATTAANLMDFIDDLPLKMNTKIGSKGNGISQGQRQRLLIARAFYKNPEFLFFDEATNALDATNEKIIMDNLIRFLSDKTAVIIAHRLSTVRHADKIIMLEKGKIVEEGTHDSLIAIKGHYYELIKNQLELGI